MEGVQSSESKVSISLCGFGQNLLCQSVFLGQLDEIWSLRETGLSSTDRERLTEFAGTIPWAEYKGENEGAPEFLPCFLTASGVTTPFILLSSQLELV